MVAAETGAACATCGGHQVTDRGCADSPLAEFLDGGPRNLIIIGQNWIRLPIVKCSRTMPPEERAARPWRDVCRPLVFPKATGRIFIARSLLMLTWTSVPVAVLSARDHREAGPGTVIEAALAAKAGQSLPACAGGRPYFTAQRCGTDVQTAVRAGEPIFSCNSGLVVGW